MGTAQSSNYAGPYPASKLIDGSGINGMWCHYPHTCCVATNNYYLILLVDLFFCTLPDYEQVTSGKQLSDGRPCGWIQTKEDCEAAAKFLGLRDTQATSVSNGHPVDVHARPRGCFYHGALYFNRNSLSPTGCTNTISCLCRVDEEAGKKYTKTPLLSDPFGSSLFF